MECILGKGTIFIAKGSVENGKYDLNGEQLSSQKAWGEQKVGFSINLKGQGDSRRCRQKEKEEEDIGEDIAGCSTMSCAAGTTVKHTQS